MKLHAPRWFPLDNAAHVFPSIESDKRTGIFRLSATLDHDIELPLLSRALGEILQRFPSFKVRMARGMFWHYLRESVSDMEPQPDVRNPCLRMDARGGHLLRVRYYKQRIAVEYHHSLTDGTGGYIFLLSLVSHYLTLRDHAHGGQSAPPGPRLPDPAPTETSSQSESQSQSQGPALLLPGTAVDPGELEDSFLRYYQKGIPRPAGVPAAWQLRLPLAPVDRPGYIRAQIPASAISAKARERELSLTGYLVSVYLYALQELRIESSGELRSRGSHPEKDRIRAGRKAGIPGRSRSRELRKPLAVKIPVNLRSWFPSISIRNFSFYTQVNLGYRAVERYSFEEICRETRHQLALGLSRQRLLEAFSPNVQAMTSVAIRLLPAFVKYLVVQIMAYTVGERLSTGTISNLGRVNLPSELEGRVKDMNFILGPNVMVSSGLAVLGFGDGIVLNWTRTSRDAGLERHFFRFLVRDGIPVRLTSNHWE